jgi:hypothetical protein
VNKLCEYLKKRMPLFYQNPQFTKCSTDQPKKSKENRKIISSYKNFLELKTEKKKREKNLFIKLKVELFRFFKILARTFLGK